MPLNVEADDCQRQRPTSGALGAGRREISVPSISRCWAIVNIAEWASAAKEEFSAIANTGSSGSGAVVLTVLNMRYRSERKTRSLSTGSPTRPHGPGRKGVLPLGTATSMKGR